MNTDELIQKYVAIRDEKEAIQDRHKQELVKYNKALSLIEAKLLTLLDGEGGQSFATKHGTAYLVTRTSAKVEDWDAVLEYIRENELWHMLERRVAKTAVTEFMEAHQSAPPGVSVVSEVGVNVNRPRKKH